MADNYAKTKILIVDDDIKLCRLVKDYLAPLGYDVTVYDGEAKAGGFIRSQIPRFRLPESVIDEETGYILDLGVTFKSGQRIDSMKALLAENYDAVFVGCGAPRGRDLNLPGRWEAAAGQIHIGIDWLASVSFGHIHKTGRRVVVLGGGNTAMDCCRSARRLGGEDVKVIVRSGFEEMKASPWEKEDAMHEGIPILNYLVPKSFEHRDGRLTGMIFEKVEAKRDERGRRQLVPTGEADVLVECDEVLIAVGQENHYHWIERDLGLEFDEWDMPVLDKASLQSTLPKVFFGGDAAFGPKNIIWAVAHGHEAAISIDKFLHGEDVRDRPATVLNLFSQKMGIHEWSYDNEISPEERFKVPWEKAEKTLKSIEVEVELDSSFFACSAASLRRWRAILSPETSTPVVSMPVRSRSAVAGGVAPSSTTTNATTDSPHSGSGLPTTAAARTPGWRSRVSSTSVIDFLMKVVVSRAISTLKSAGNSRFICSYRL